MPPTDPQATTERPPAVFVHGNPETTAIWDPLLAELGRDDVVRLSPPGFGSPLPPGFGARVEDYRQWLVAELEAIGRPVDLVGHDWGGGHVVNVAMTRPDLLHSWVSDALGVFHPDYDWHHLAQVWQTPGKGEEAVAEQFGSTEALLRILRDRGIPEETARRVAEGLDADTGRAVLTLYRSAAQPVMARLGEGLERAARTPGLAVVATADRATATVEQRRLSASRAGAAVHVLDGLGHWWMVEDPGAGARMLRDFWATVPTAPDRPAAG
ncbi:alpha/beta fold hydrolase [Streptomyces sp. NPDC054784]